MSEKNKIYIIGVILGAIIVVLTIFFIYPIFRGIKNNSQELINIKKELIFSTNQIEEFKKFQKDYEEYRLNLKKTDNLFIDTQTPLDFIQFLEEISQGASLEISSITYSPRGKKDGIWDGLTFQFLLKGPYNNVLKFLEKMENSNYLINIQDFNIRELSDREIKESDKYSLGDVRGFFLIKVFTK